jgi:hypothetical protein
MSDEKLEPIRIPDEKLKPIINVIDNLYTVARAKPKADAEQSKASAETPKK